MQSKFFTTLFLIFALAACMPATAGPTEAQEEASVKPPTATHLPPTPTRTRTVTPSAVPTPSRIAALSEVEPLVEARASSRVDFLAASTGQVIPVGGEARSGENGRARLDLTPDGTIIRLAPNSHFTLAALEDAPGNPYTALELFFGKVFIILSGGELDVETPSGVASVRGSMMSVNYNPEDSSMSVTCLEGHCNLRTKDASVDLVAGQAADVRDGLLSQEPRSITDAEMQEWLDYVPELNDHPVVLEFLQNRLKELRDRRDPPNIFPRPRP